MLYQIRFKTLQNSFFEQNIYQKRNLFRKYKRCIIFGLLRLAGFGFKKDETFVFLDKTHCSIGFLINNL